jgi:hypothetical protein
LWRVVSGTVESKAEQTTAVISFDLHDMYMMSAREASHSVSIN